MDHLHHVLTSQHSLQVTGGLGTRLWTPPRVFRPGGSSRPAPGPLALGVARGLGG